MTDRARIVREIGADKRSGATALLRRAAAALRLAADDLPSAGDRWPQTLTLATDAVASVRPAFGGLRRLAGAVQDAVDRNAAPEDAARRVRLAVDAFTGALDRDADRIVARAAHLLDPEPGRPAPRTSPGPSSARVLTISASSLVERTLLRAASGLSLQVTCLESRPMLEGAALARRLADAGLRVVLTLDALGPSLVGEGSMVLVGGDTLVPEGLIHKAGTYGLALAARRAGVPVYALVGPEKLLPSLPDGALADGGDPGELVADDLLAEAPPGLEIRVPYFDLTPLDMLTGVVMPGGIVRPDEAARLAAAVRPYPTRTVPTDGP